MARLKKSRSDAILTATAVNPKNFYIHKKTRFAIRGFEIVTGFLVIMLAHRQDTDLMTASGMYQCLTFTIFLAYLAPLIAAVSVALYLAPIFMKWTSLKLLLIETALDAVILTGYTGSFISFFTTSQATTSNAVCFPGKSAECDKLNWLLALESVAIAFWFASASLDVKGLYLGMYPDDAELESELEALRRRPSVKV